MKFRHFKNLKRKSTKFSEWNFHLSVFVKLIWYTKTRRRENQKKFTCHSHALWLIKSNPTAWFFFFCFVSPVWRKTKENGTRTFSTCVKFETRFLFFSTPRKGKKEKKTPKNKHIWHTKIRKGKPNNVGKTTIKSQH